MRFIISAIACLVCVTITSAQSVDDFTGAFNYDLNVVTVPGPHGSGYSINLHYNSDVHPEEEASIVGYGWGLSLPMIQRSRKGLPDDYKKATVKGLHKVPKRTMVSVQPWYYPEVFKLDLESPSISPAQMSLTVRYDSEKGLGLDFGAGIKYKFGDLQGSVTTDQINGVLEKGVIPFFKEAFVPRSSSNLYSTTMINTGVSSSTFQGTLKFGDVAGGTEIGVDASLTEVTYGHRWADGYGYLYSYDAVANKVLNGLLDYSTDRNGAPEGIDRPYSTIPYADFDTYIVSAAGISGAFRAFHRYPLEVNPLPSTASTNIVNVAIEVSIAIGAGGSFNGGYIANTVSGLPKTGQGSLAATDDDYYVTSREPFLFRYINDRADAITYASNNDPAVGSVNGGMDLALLHERNRDLPIRTNLFVKPSFDGLTLSPALNSGSITSFEIVDEGGNEWKFNDAAVVWADTSQTFVLRNESSFDNLTSPRIQYSADENRDPASYYQEYHGYVLARPYVSEYLATSLTTPDYVDVTSDGPTTDDKGGWTKFTWKTQAEKFRTRTPYNGYLLDKGNLENAHDDKLSYHRQTRQYKLLCSLETKTHKAVFVYADELTEPRRDGWQAQDEKVAQNPSLAKDGANKNTYLKKIILFKKGSPDIPIRTTHFQYDYSLAPGNPSSETGFGKLTLTKVWFEDSGIKDADIQPIEFAYQYPDLVSSGATDASQINVGDVESRYASVEVPDIDAEEQNPEFDPNEIDGWGYYGAVGEQAAIEYGGHDNGLIYDYSTLSNSDDDPAAYRLKRITMPSGSEIVPVYEPRDYNWVQDSTAMQLYPLSPRSLVPEEPWNGTIDGYDKSVLQVPLGAMGEDDRNRLLADLNRRFVTNGERLYTKLLYGYALPNSPSYSPPTQAVGYVRTYVKVEACSLVTISGSNRIDIHLDDPTGVTSATIRGLIDYSRKLPWSRALQAYQKACDEHYRPDLSGKSIEDIALTLLDLLFGSRVAITTLPGDNLLLHRYPVLIPEASYVRLPSMTPKQGNGSRVKAVYVFNPDGTLEDGDASVVGTQYSYTMAGPDGRPTSSGVVTQEPSPIREQMGIVQVLPDLLEETRKGESFRDLDILRAEMPLGEALLPRPMLGHRRVVTTSLFDGHSQSPTIVKSYLTTVDHPSVKVVASSRNLRRDRIGDIFQILFRVSDENAEIEQGFSLFAHDVMGAPQKVEKFIGRESVDPESGALLPGILSSGTYYSYRDATDEVPLYMGPNRPLRMGRPGAHMDFIAENQLVASRTRNVTLQWGASVTGVYPLFGAMPRIQIDNQTVKTYTTSKTIYQPLYLESVRTVNDGAVSTSQTIAVDYRTGADAIVQIKDGHDGLEINGESDPHVGNVTTVITPALDYYPAMGHRSESEGRTFRLANSDFPDGGVWSGNVTAVTFNLTLPSPRTYIGIPIGVLPSSDQEDRARVFSRLFAVGDVLTVNTSSATTDVTVTNVSIIRSPISPYPPTMVALDINTSLGNTAVKYLTIKKSAKRNMTSAPLSSVSVYGVDFDDQIEYAKKLRSREQFSERLNDWLRRGWGNAGLLWERPLARYEVNAANTTTSNLEDLEYAYGTGSAPFVDEVATGVCFDASPTYLELFLSKDVQVTTPTAYPTRHPIDMYYKKRDVSGDDCVGSPLSGYEADMGVWTRWRKFGVNDNARLVTGLDFGPDDKRLVNEIFDFRTEGGWDGAHHTTWSTTSGDLLGLNPPVAFASTFENVLSASGTKYLATTAARPTYRPEAVYAANKPTRVVSAGVHAEGNWDDAGTYDELSPFTPPSTTTSPSAPWVLLNRIVSWTDHGGVKETEGRSSVLRSSIAESSSDLVQVTCIGSPAMYVWAYDAETDGSSSQITSHTGEKSGRATPASDFSKSPTLPAVTGLIANTYTIRMWLKYTCASSDVEVNLGASTYTGSTLDAAFVAAVEDWRLYEFTQSSSCSTVVVDALGSGLYDDIFVDDILIRPTEAIATTVVYDKLDRPVAVLDDAGWASILHYDARGRHVRTSVESVRGRDVVTENSLWLKTRRRQEAELDGGAVEEALPMPTMQQLRGYVPDPKLSLSPLKPASIQAKASLLDFNLTPQRAQLRTLPGHNISTDVNGGQE